MKRALFDDLFSKALVLTALALAVPLHLGQPANAQDVTIQQPLALNTGANWDITSIPVCYVFDSTNTATSTRAFRNNVQRVLAETWARHSRLAFSDVGACVESRQGVRVKFTTDTSSALPGMFEGRKGYTSLNLNASDGTVVHEFGHVLNFSHSQARQDNPNWCVTDLGNSDPIHPTSELTRYDPDSIMNYCRTQDYRIGHLSPLDIQAVQQVYGVNASLSLGANEAGDFFGYGLAAGNFDGDGFADVVVGAPLEEFRGQRLAGAGFAYRGNAVGALRPTQLLTQDGMGNTEPEDRLGWLVKMGDLDGDGIDEVFLSAPFEKPGSDPQARGALFAYKWDGAALAPLATFSPSAASGLRFAGLIDFLVADVSGDGRAEVFLNAQTPAGVQRVLPVYWDARNRRFVEQRAFITNGATTMAAADLTSSPGLELVIGYGGGERPGTPKKSGHVQVLEFPAASDGTPGIAPNIVADISQRNGASPEAGDRFGDSVTTGDFNGDGLMDIAIGTPSEAIDSSQAAGLVSVLYNSTRSPTSPLTFAPQQHFDQNDLGLGGAEAGDRFGNAVVAGDFNGDGFADLAIGLPGEQASRLVTRPGYIQIAYGSFDGIGNTIRGTTMVSQAPLSENTDGDQFGARFVAIDLDADGADELVVGAPNNDARNGTRAGNVMIFKAPVPQMEGWYSIDQAR
ncbi:M12 family metallopeptidase [Dinoroseobacter sp. S76]|uniref:M12 family metallopeptidase n=1 Tax=Dinoroseobacter sp. S76 TaxID=3415124 RepID=UPI003C7DE44A